MGCSFSPQPGGDSLGEQRPWRCAGGASMDASKRRQETQEPEASKTPRGSGKVTVGLLKPGETRRSLVLVELGLCSRKANESCPRTVNSLSRFPSGCGQMDLVPHRLELWSDEPNAVRRPAQVGVGAGESHIVGAIILVVAVEDRRGFVKVIPNAGGLASARNRAVTTIHRSRDVQVLLVAVRRGHGHGANRDPWSAALRLDGQILGAVTENRVLSVSKAIWHWCCCHRQAEVFEAEGRRRCRCVPTHPSAELLYQLGGVVH